MTFPERANRTATTVLVRHADPEADGTTDPPLSDAGQARVRALLHALEHVEVDAVFHSEYARTRQTAVAVADARSVQAEEVAAGDGARLVTRLQQLPPHSTALVVGHSNTVPELISGIGGGTVPPIGDREFDNLYVVGAGRTLHLQYGAPT